MTAVTRASSSARDALLKRFQDRLEINSALNRSLVSYQSNRKRPFFRWFKYKEGFSAALVEYVLGHYGVRQGALLDPFAGSGAAILVGRQHGLAARGIELLPLGVAVVRARLAAEQVSPTAFASSVEAFRSGRWRGNIDGRHAYRHLAITRGAFAEETESELNQFQTFLATSRLKPPVRLLLDTACLSVLEAVSFTRKDGQYLRWDRRAPRDLAGKTFHKGAILGFREAMLRQLEMMGEDIAAREQFADAGAGRTASAEIEQGSCLKMLPAIPSRSCQIVVTSPPYCNRYDYTRTYALELAYLGVGESQIKELRQDLLSCTVENKSKVDELRDRYEMIGRSETFTSACQAFERQKALREVLSVLDQKGGEGKLNNPNVPRMVRNYFLESAVVIFELARIVAPGGRVVMVNDNVQYAGEEVPVDLILSALAEEAGFHVERIWVLERGKGNSSQQMGVHGRNELRKCAYVWRR